MSLPCKKHFIQDNCFYECEPHIGLWVVNTTRKISSERYFKVPLCSKDCDEWFKDCKNDYTCVYNWPREFKFQKGHNICPENSQCLTFSEMYKTAKDFCENVWDHSWKYTESEFCMHIWFDGVADVKKKVAEHYIDLALSPSTASTSSSSWYFFVLIVVLAQIMGH
uniref:Folate receptor beta n=1 Tax=Parasteatoda tepidariorum TaxID=114398 RepID=A0A2L2Y0U5_PARTP